MPVPSFSAPTARMTTLAGEIDKIAAHQQGPAITRGAIDAVVIPALSAQTFDISDAVVKEDFETALSKLQEPLRHADRPHRRARRHRGAARRLFYARVILSAGGGQKELMELTGLKSYPAGLTMTAARRVTDGFCQKAVELVLQTDVAMKTGADDPSGCWSCCSCSFRRRRGMDKLRIRQAIVVEGKYDQNALRQLVDTPDLHHQRLYRHEGPALLRLLRQAAETTGLIILTDSDGAGFLIRNTLKSALPAEGVLHAYIPDIPGKERRKTAPGKEGLLGVEGMRPEILLQALRNAGADFEDAQSAREPVTKQDFFHPRPFRPARQRGKAGGAPQAPFPARAHERERPAAGRKRAVLPGGIPGAVCGTVKFFLPGTIFRHGFAVPPSLEGEGLRSSHEPKAPLSGGAVSRRLTERLSLYRTAFQTET